MTTRHIPRLSSLFLCFTTSTLYLYLYHDLAIHFIQTKHQMVKVPSGGIRDLPYFSLQSVNSCSRILIRSWKFEPTTSSIVLVLCSKDGASVPSHPIDQLTRSGDTTTVRLYGLFGQCIHTWTFLFLMIKKGRTHPIKEAHWINISYCAPLRLIEAQNSIQTCKYS